jgi:toxin secretion/phage lysis holin
MLLLQAFLSPIRDCFPAQLAIAALLILILLDWVFGIANALIHHEFSSSKMREGIGHKCSELGFVVVGIVMDAMITSGIDIGFQGPILTTIALYLCVMEIGSLLETFAKIYPKLAKSPAFKLLASAHVIDMENVEESKEENDG